MTVAQYLEMRYSRGVRTFAGVLSWIAGMINFGFFPLISSRFFIATHRSAASIPLRRARSAHLSVVTAITVALPLLFVLFGGHLTVLVSDFMQGLFMNVAALTLVFTVLSTAFHWDQILFSLKLCGASRRLASQSPPHFANQGLQRLVFHHRHLHRRLLRDEQHRLPGLPGLGEERA